MDKAKKVKVLEILENANKKKYELTDEYVEKTIGQIPHRKTVKAYRIRALVNIKGTKVKKGDLGGYVQSESNLSQQGSCWIFDNAVALENSKVEKNAILKNNARISGNAVATDFAMICDNGQVANNAKIMNYGKVFNLGLVMDNAVVRCFGKVRKVGIIKGNAWVSDNAQVLDNIIDKNQIVAGTAVITSSTNPNSYSDNKIFYSKDIPTNTTYKKYLDLKRIHIIPIKLNKKLQSNSNALSTNNDYRKQYSKNPDVIEVETYCL